ncbi:MAG: hypothetical protein EOQ50_18455 [Mesorhizobium sp.]|uniref:hypothetical protein n=1 Tax=Mesorhizobium sp. TaxID=1871066 RepID=UPI000FE7A9AF|nr:hypothetical protein [Mesorhizobium sp.]RWB72950.1 MAG: hypothetical protein EOQ50_18455 [Mesorhizobium sp.]
MQRYSGVFEPEDLDLLQRVFDQLCKERGIAQTNSEQREALASDIVSAFQNGVADEAALLQRFSAG